MPGRGLAASGWARAGETPLGIWGILAVIRPFCNLSPAAPSWGGGSVGRQYRGGDAQVHFVLPSLSLPPSSRALAPRRKRLLTSAVRPALCFLAQMTWPSLRAEFPALSPAQLYRVLSQCQAAMDVGCIAAWQPGEEENPATFQPGEPLALCSALLRSPTGSLQGFYGQTKQAIPFPSLGLL